MRRAEREVEIKLATGSAAAARRMLRQAGFRVSRRRVFEANTVFDTPGRRMLRAGTLLRLREAGGQATLTFKGPASGRRHKSREELETPVPEPATVTRIFERLSFKPVFRYEKYRTEYAQNGRIGHVMLDETPAGVFLELEGPPRWIDRTARQLGFSPADYITATYAELYAQHGARAGKQ